MPNRVARVCDDLLDFFLLAFAAWTVVYHLCLVLRVGTLPAAIAQGVALVLCGLFLRGTTAGDEAASPPAARSWSRRTLGLLVAANLAAGTAAAALFAFTDVPWRWTWPFFMLAAGLAFALAGGRPAARPGAGSSEPDGGLSAWLSAGAALGWATVLGVGTLFLVRSAEDDAYYVHLSSWIAEHGVFPLRDTLFSDQVLPAVIYPPLSSFEAAAGTIARGTGLAAPDVVYYGTAPLVAVLGVLSLWRLQRAWRVPLAGLALTAAVVFLVFDAPTHRALGNVILGRTWHGKVALAAVLVPLLFVLLQQYAERPARRQLVLLAAAGAAGVGLSSSGVFLVPIVAAGCCAWLALRAPRQALAGFAATVAYPVGAGLVAAAVGGRTAETNPYSAPGNLLGLVLHEGLLAFLALAAVLVAPVVVPRAAGAGMAAGTVLLVGLVLAPPVTSLLYDVTGLGRVLWRLLWAVPVAALVGALAVGLSRWIRPPALRAVPPVLLCGILVVWGSPLWARGGITFESSPSWKRPPESVAAARWILAETRAGDVVLAPTELSQTIAAVSGSVYTVAPRVFYAVALGRDAPSAHGRARLVLQGFADGGLATPTPRTRTVPKREDVVRALDVVGVDLACAVDVPDTRRTLLAAGYSPAGDDGSVVCMRAPDGRR